MKEFYGNNWQKILNENDMGDFDALWRLDAGWFEKPNQRRGGWSGVSKIKLVLPGGGETGAFLKRQENHISKAILHPIKGVSTFQREFQNIQCFIKKGLPTVDPIYFACRDQEGALQAILITRELEGYQPLSANQFCSNGEIMGDKRERTAILRSLATMMRKMHGYHLQHNCLYAKHVFVKKIGDTWDVRLIDLEKLRWRLFKRSAILRDIGTLYRHGPFYQQKLSSQLLFLKVYMGELKLSEASKSIWRAVRKSAVLKKGGAI